MVFSSRMPNFSMLRWASANFTKASLAAGWGSRTPITENTSPKAARQVCPEGRPYLALNGEARDLAGRSRQGARQAGGQGLRGVYTPRAMSTPPRSRGGWVYTPGKLVYTAEGAPLVPPSDQIREKAGSGLEPVAWSAGRAPVWDLDGWVLRPALPEELCDRFLCLGFTVAAHPAKGLGGNETTDKEGPRPLSAAVQTDRMGWHEDQLAAVLPSPQHCYLPAPGHARPKLA